MGRKIWGEGKMLICDPSLATSNVDKMAIEHLQKAGIIYTRRKAPKAPRAPRGRIAWKALEATNWKHSGGCRQCGDSSGLTPEPGPYGMKLCQRCLDVHAHSIKAGLTPNDEISW